MTANTDAELLHALEESQSLFSAMLHEPRPTSEIQKQMEQNRAAIDAARRAPAAPVPHGWKLVPDDANMTDEQAEAICAVAKVCGGGAYDIYRAALAAAPQPPEAAPVQMPEPAGWVYSFIHSSATGKPDLRVDSITTDRDRAYSEGHSDQFALYTEHQVSQLLAAHGIK